MQIDKPWGWEIILNKTKHYVLKQLFIRKGSRLSLQYHQVKHETVYVLEGELNLYLGMLDKPQLIVQRGGYCEIRPKDVHRFAADKEDVLLLEVSTIELDDVVRLGDDYGRR